jgi:hypothetical protein|tara:strand:+ start:1180 stop:1743 length:564 start_codon:yes stop_codon:yes gene_type:complete
MELKEKISLVREIAPPVSGMPKSTLLNLKVGSVVRINTLTNPLQMVEQVFEYTETNKHGQKKNFKWKEYMLRDLKDFTVSFLEVEDDDELLAYLTGEKVAQGRLSDTPHKGLKQLNIEGAPIGTLYLEEFCHAVFDGKNGEEQVLMLDYESDNGDMFGVEVWEGGNIEAFFYKEVNVKNIEVISHAK